MLERTRWGIGIGLCFSVISVGALADHPTLAFGNESAGAINTISAKTLPQGSWGVGVRSEYITNNKFSTEQLEDFATQGLEGVHSIDTLINTSFSLSFGMMENFSISARLPYIIRKNIRESEIGNGEPEAHTHGDSSGIGDIVLFGQYQLFAPVKMDISILFGAKIPTGQDDIEDHDGNRYESEFQPGTGSWDFLIGMSISKSVHKLGYHANILFDKTTKGSQSTRVGDFVSYNLALTYQVNDSHTDHDHVHSNTINWDLSIELNGESRQMNTNSGESEENSGGTTVYMSPGIRASAGKYSGFISYGIPVFEDQNGTQTGVGSRIVVGTSYSF